MYLAGTEGRSTVLTIDIFSASCSESADTASTGGLSARSPHKGNGLQKNSKHGVISKSISISVDVNKLAREKWKVDRGYSSGASSYGSDDDDEVTSGHREETKVILELPFDPKKIPKPHKSLHRNTSEVSCLSELKETIEKDGDFSKTIVRMEVRHV